MIEIIISLVRVPRGSNKSEDFFKKKRFSNKLQPMHARWMVEQHMHEITDIGGKKASHKFLDGIQKNDMQ